MNHRISGNSHHPVCFADTPPLAGGDEKVAFMCHLEGWREAPGCCAPVEAKSCSAAESCSNSTPGEIGAPAFIRIDFDKQVVVGPQRTTPIMLIEKDESQIVLMGTELGYGWTMVLDQESGELSATLSNRDGTFVLFGSCTPL